MAWQGIFKNHSDIPYPTSSFDIEEWCEKQKNRVETFDEEIDLARERNQFLINFLNQLSQESINILDWGGSLGTTYLAIKDLFSINYNIVENSKLVTTGRRLFKKDPFLKFWDVIPNLSKALDIVYIRTSLQYSHDWRKTLTQLCSLKAEHFLLADLSAGNHPTFLSCQVWHDKKVPYWWINIDELQELLEANNYKIKTRAIAQNLEDTPGWKSIVLFPEAYRPQFTTNLHFQRQEKTNERS